MAIITLTKDKYGTLRFAKVDDFNKEWLDKWFWSVSGSGYACRMERGKHISMHVSIMERHLGRKIKKGYVINHINGNQLDNRIENLEEVTKSKDLKNRRGYGKANVTGAIYHQQAKCWRIAINFNPNITQEQAEEEIKKVRAILIEDGFIERTYCD